MCNLRRNSYTIIDGIEVNGKEPIVFTWKDLCKIKPMLLLILIAIIFLILVVLAYLYFKAI